MLNKKYELIKDGITIESHDKCREGLDELLESAEVILEEGHAEHDLMIVCTTYNSLGGIEFCEEVQDFDLHQDSPYREDEIDESMDGDFDSAMKSAGFGTDEDYGDEISPMGIWG
jgi:hypothetical protein|tara:strand:- start:6579 stop:6923 length:345 start_codon:yes stop_codon:yes gene_type:complete